MGENRPRPMALFGAAGRVGREILQQAHRFDTLRITHGYDVSRIGEPVEGLVIERVPDILPQDIRGVIDFSLPEAVKEHVALVEKARVPYVLGVTALPDAVQQMLAEVAERIAVLYAPNMSPGMNVLFNLAPQIAKALPGYERHIIEVHHTRKKDSPSGTALHLAGTLRESGHGETPITALRIGDVTGEHRVIFGGPGEHLEIIHRADSRAVFAVGALRAAEWLIAQPPGLYSMREVLGG